jgi:DNA-directed RNA polymerase specialized sigma24 family protein
LEKLQSRRAQFRKEDGEGAKERARRQERNAEYQIDAEKRLYQFLLDSMETAVSELDELERKLVECRYIHNWSMGKCAMEIGYSEKTLFLMKKSLLDKLLVSLAAITNI